MDIENVDDTLEVENAALIGSTFTDVDLSESLFSDARLDRASFTNISMVNVRIRDADLTGVSIEDCALERMTIDGILVTELLAAYEKQRATSAVG